MGIFWFGSGKLVTKALEEFGFGQRCGAPDLGDVVDFKARIGDDDEAVIEPDVAGVTGTRPRTKKFQIRRAVEVVVFFDVAVRAAGGVLFFDELDGAIEVGGDFGGEMVNY